MSSKVSDSPWSRWIPVALIAIGIFVASSIPGSSLPGLLLFAGQDKAEHFTVYASFGFFVARALAARPGLRRARLGWFVATAAVGLLYGLSDEFHQSFVPGRAVEGLDLLADSTGSALGATLAIVWYGGWYGGRGGGVPSSAAQESPAAQKTSSS